MTREVRFGIAGELLAFGATVRAVPGKAAETPAFVAEADRALIEGVVLRTAYADKVAEGEPITVVTNGGLMALLGGVGHPAWVELRRGKLVDA